MRKNTSKEAWNELAAGTLDARRRGGVAWGLLGQAGINLSFSDRNGTPATRAGNRRGPC